MYRVCTRAEVYCDDAPSPPVAVSSFQQSYFYSRLCARRYNQQSLKGGGGLRAFLQLEAFVTVSRRSNNHGQLFYHLVNNADKLWRKADGVEVNSCAGSTLLLLHVQIEVFSSLSNHENTFS